MAMASNQTSNYGLCQWEATDRVLHTDFNEDNQKIDAALASKASNSTVTALSSRVSSLESNKADQTELDRVENISSRAMAGTYTGTGKYGSSSPNTLDFSSSLGRAPLFVIVRKRESQASALVLVRGITSTMHNLSGSYSSSSNVTVSWTGQKVSWYATTLAPQMNESGVTYCYFAVG